MYRHRDQEEQASTPGQARLQGTSGLVMSFFMGIFGVLWTVFAAGIGGGYFALFGLVFVAIAIFQGVTRYRSSLMLAEHLERQQVLEEQRRQRERRRAEAEAEAFERKHQAREPSYSTCDYCETRFETSLGRCPSCSAPDSE